MSRFARCFTARPIHGTESWKWFHELWNIQNKIPGHLIIKMIWKQMKLTWRAFAFARNRVLQRQRQDLLKGDGLASRPPAEGARHAHRKIRFRHYGILLWKYECLKYLVHFSSSNKFDWLLTVQNVSADLLVSSAVEFIQRHLSDYLARTNSFQDCYKLPSDKLRFSNKKQK